LAGAGPLVMLAFLPFCASADTTSQLTYDGRAQSYGVFFNADQSPSPSPVSNLFLVQAPAASSDLNTSGTTQAQAMLVYPGNAGAAFSLLCVGHPPQTTQLCDGISTLTTKTPLGPFPLTYPFLANATPDTNGKPQYPILSSQEIGAGTPVDLFAAKAVATATDT